MNETEIRDRLLDLAEDAPEGSTAPPQLLRRARRRVVFTLASSIAIVVVLFGAGIAGVHAFRSIDKQPAVEPSEDPFATIHGWIVYRTGTEIVAVDPADPNDTLVLGPTVEADPIAWSADGTKLLLRGTGPLHLGEGNLHVMSRIGRATSVHGLSPAAKWGSFSPDGSEIAYGTSGNDPGPYVIDAVGGRPRSLGEPCGNRCGQPFPEAAAWSPDGTRIAWIDFVWEDFYVLSFVNPDGTGLQTGVTRLPVSYDPPEGVWSLTWSPDGSRLAFSVSVWGGDRPGHVFVLNADGSGLRRITKDGDDRWPTWSPDGSRIAFVHDGTLYSMAPDGTDMQEVAGVHPDGAIAWNPVG